MNQLKGLLIGLVAFWCILALAKGDDSDLYEAVSEESGELDDALYQSSEDYDQDEDSEYENEDIETETEEDLDPDTDSCNGRSGFFRSRGSCKHFYRCHNDIRYNFKCGMGTEYSETLKTCVLPNANSCKV